MSKRARTREQVEAAKWIGLAPLDDDPDGELIDAECSHCHDDGMDPMTDYLLPCPVCQGEQTA